MDNRSEIMKKYKSVLLGAAVGIAVTVGGIFLAALILFMTNASALFVSIASKLIMIIAAFFAGFTAGKLSISRRFFWGLLSGLSVYLIIMLMTLVLGSSEGIATGDLISLIIFSVFSSVGGMLS